MSKILDTNELVVAFSKIANISFDEACSVKELILAGAQEVLANLKDGVDIESNNERLVQASAANAYCNYCMVKDLDKAQKVELDGVSIVNKSDNICKRAREVKNSYMLMISDILSISSAAFKGVDINVK